MVPIQEVVPNLEGNTDQEEIRIIKFSEQKEQERCGHLFECYGSSKNEQSNGHQLKMCVKSRGVDQTSTLCKSTKSNELDALGTQLSSTETKS